MRILHLVHQYPPEHIGGTELYTQALARDLAARSHDVSVFYPSMVAASRLEPRTEVGVQVWAAQSAAGGATRRFLATFRAPGLAAAFRAVIRAARPELIHVQHLMGLPAEILRDIQWQAIPFVVTLHDYWWVCANAQLLTNDSQQVCAGPDGWRNCARCAWARAGVRGPLAQAGAPALVPLVAARGRVLRQGVAAARCFVAPARFVRDWHIAHGFPPDRICWVPHGIERPTQPARPREVRPLRFAYIGGLTPQKGVHIVLQAFSQLRTPAELWIAGSESADPAYVAGLRALSQGAPIRFLGALSRDRVWDTLAQVDALVVPSLWYETFSLITHEAFAAGVPVIASRLGVLADAVRDGVDGLLAAPGDVPAWRQALQQLADDPTLRAQLRAGVRPPLPQEKHVAQIEALYQRCLAGVNPCQDPIQ